MKASDLVESRKIKLLKYARRNLSPYVYFSDWDESDASATMGIEIQEPIMDSGEGGPTVRSILLNNIGIIQLDVKGEVQGPTRTELTKMVAAKYSQLINHSHSILLPLIYDRLVRVQEVSLAMAPFRKIILLLEEMGEVSMEKLQYEMGRRKGVDRYITLLSDLDFIKSEDGMIRPGAKMKGLKAQNVETPQLYEVILSEVMQKRSKYLTEVLHLTMMVPYLRWSNAYYLPSYEAGRLIKFSREELFKNYTWYYRLREKYSTFIDQLQKVINVKILNRKDKFYYGQEDIFESYSKAADREQLVSLK
ncbi:MAG: hypothetical protein QXQ39_06550 [Conexivisphaerales archaeon]